MPHIVFYSGSSEKHRIKQVSSLLHAWSVGEQTGGKKLADILSPWQPVVCNLKVADRKSLKLAVGIPPHFNQKFEPRTGYQINLQSGAIGKKDFHIDGTSMSKIVTIKRTIRKFVNIAVHIESLRHPPRCLFETLFSCNGP